MRSFLWLYQSKIPCGLLLGLVFLTLPPSALAECTARKNTLGHLNYHCTDGNNGQIRKNALGNWLLRLINALLARSGYLAWHRVKNCRF